MKHRRPVDSLPVHCFYHWYKRIHGHVQVQYRVEFYHRVESLPLPGSTRLVLIPVYLVVRSRFGGQFRQVRSYLSVWYTCMIMMIHVAILFHMSPCIMSQGACTGRAGRQDEAREGAESQKRREQE